MTNAPSTHHWARPEVSEVHNFLHSFNGMIMHFSGTSPGRGKKHEGHMFPVDLLHVLSSEAMGGLSASIVKQGDRFSSCGHSNATGFVGVVLDRKLISRF